MLANMQYAAQLKGVGTCFWGNSTIFVEKQPRLRKALGLHADEKIYGGLYLGYPAVKFHNKVFGKQLPIQWNAQRIEAKK